MLATTALAAAAERPAPPLIVEPDLYSYTFPVPDGWAFSSEQASEFGVSLVLFGEGSDFHGSNAVMYVTELCKRECRGATQREMSTVLDSAHAESPSLRVETGAPIVTKSGAKAQVRILSGASDPRQAREALAFVPGREVIALLVLSVKDTSSWEQDFAAFQQVVAGYRLFTCDTPGLHMGCRKKPAAWTPEQFDVGLQRARANERAPEWNAYSGPFFERLGPIVQHAMQQCFPVSSKPSTDSFTLVFSIRGDGSLAQSMVRPEASDTGCVLEWLGGARVPAPPHPGWWVFLDMKVKP